MRVAQLMKKKVRSIDPDATTGEAILVMKLHRIRHLLVLDRGGLAGIVSERDLLPWLFGELEAKVSDVMTPDLVTARPDTPLHRAAALMARHTISALPVMEKGKLVGIITTTDLLRAIGRGALHTQRRTAVAPSIQVPQPA
jgi:acetoin utilization protein AcuB